MSGRRQALAQLGNADTWVRIARLGVAPRSVKTGALLQQQQQQKLNQQIDQ